MELGEHVESCYSTSCTYYYLCIIIVYLKLIYASVAAGFLLTMVLVLVSLLLPNRVAIIHAPHNYSIIYLHNNLDQCHIFNACTAHTLEEQERRA